MYSTGNLYSLQMLADFGPLY